MAKSRVEANRRIFNEANDLSMCEGKTKQRKKSDTCIMNTFSRT